MAEERTTTRTPRWLVLGAVLVTLTAVGFAWLWLTTKDVGPDEVTDYLQTQDAAVEAVAVEVFTAITTYDPGSIEGTTERIRELATGDFLSDFEELLEQGLGDVLAETATTSEGELVEDPSVGLTTADEAIAIGRLAQEVTTQEGTRTIFSVMRLSLVRQNDEWKASELEILSQNSL